MNLQALNERSSTKRGQIALVRAGLANGAIPLPDLLADIPECIAHRPAWEVISWVRWVGVNRVADLNRLAMNADVNLARPLRDLSRRQRDWIAENVLTLGRARR